MKRDIIVIGASAGGVEAIPRLLSSFPAGSRASFFVTLHISADYESCFPALISRQSPLVAEHPKDGALIRPGHVYVAPPDYHLLVRPGAVQLSHGPKENRHRPAIDPLFRSAARYYGERVAGVLLTGNLDDGVAGLVEIQQRGGLALVQDPDEATFPEMPRNALQALKPDHCLPLAKMETLLKHLLDSAPVGGSMKGKRPASKLNKRQGLNAVPPPGQPVAFACPECHGPMWESREGKMLQFRCLVGHRYSLASLLEAHAEELEAALWIALRTLEERVNLQRRLVEQSRRAGQEQARKVFQAKANENLKHAKLLRGILETISG